MNANALVLPSVVLADDDEDDFLIFSLAIEQTPIKTTLTHAKNGTALMQMLENFVPNFLFLDLLMPGKDGIQCLREIRNNRKFDGMYIIVYSSLHTLYHIEICYIENANAFVEKTGNLDALKEILQSAFSLDWKATVANSTLDEFVILPQTDKYAI